jgi:hypothetical protein
MPDLDRNVEPAEFATWLQKGLGRAILALRTHPPHRYRDQILHACLQYLAYDTQCENHREQYLFDLIQVTGDASWYREQLLTALKTPSEEKDLWQVVGILRRFAQQGDAEAQRAIYDAFDQNVTGDNLSDAYELIALDGIRGFLHAISALADKEPDCEEYWQFVAWVDELEERDGEEEAWRELTDASERNTILAGWCSAFKARRAESERRWARRSPEPRPKLATIVDLVTGSTTVEEARIRGKLRSAGRRASKQIVKAAARSLEAEADPDRLTRWIQFFGMTAFPRRPTAILGRTYSEDEGRRFDAALALSNVCHPDVRARALELANEEGREGECALLLESSFMLEDGEVLQRLLNRSLEDEAYHQIVTTVRLLQDDRLSDLTDELQILAYEKTPCSLCRGGIVDELLKGNRLPEWMREECLWDSDEQTRKAVGATTA